MASKLYRYLSFKLAIYKLHYVVNHLAPLCRTDCNLNVSTSYNNDTHTITIGYDFGSDMMEEYFRVIDKYWGFNLFKHHFNYDFISLLHEIGHYYTFEMPEAQEHQHHLEVRAVFALLDRDMVCNEMPRLIDDYYHLPKEAAATTWMIDWIIAHPRKAAFYNRLMK